MIEPVEAEMARPPIFNDKQEAVLRDENIETPGAVTRAGTPNSSDVAPTVIGSNDSNKDLEKAAGKIIVKFEPGESPREWNKGKKW